jgi:hypothetical protein
LIVDTYTGLAIGYGPTEKPSQAIVSIVLYPRWVNLFFLNGARLADPQRRLKGTGRRVRHVRLDDAATLEDPAIVALVRGAVTSATPAIQPRGRGRTLIFPEAARKRPRRPPKSSP